MAKVLTYDIPDYKIKLKSTHKIDQQMAKVLTNDIPGYKIKLKIRQLQVMGKKYTRQINNTGYEWYIGS